MENSKKTGISKASKAYTIFFEECNNFLPQLDSVFACEEGKFESSFRELRITYHKLRGGAGFFGFEQIASLASQLEACCIDEKAPVRSDCKKLQDELRCEILLLPHPPTP